MNDTMTLLLATAILAAGGFGLYIYKSSDHEEKVDEEYNEDSLFSPGNFWGSKEQDQEEYDLADHEIYEPKVKSRGSKTKRTRKTTGTKRRY
jgi:hypothetical protein